MVLFALHSLCQTNDFCSFSYKYVDHSIANGRLPEGQDLEKYRAGPSAPRPMGASHIPRKATRTEFSLKDDQTVYDWLRPLELEGAPVSGTKIYQDLAEKVHTTDSVLQTTTD